MGFGIATPTIANSSIVPLSYVSTGATFALAIGFIPSKVEFYATTNSWVWIRGMAFGDAVTATGSYVSQSDPRTGCVLDVLDGSGVASTNVATTSQTIGLLIGTNSIVNNGAALTYRGVCYR